MSLEETFVPEEVFHPHTIFSPLKKAVKGIGGKASGLENFMEILKMGGSIILLMVGSLPCLARRMEFGFGLKTLAGYGPHRIFILFFTQKEKIIGCS